MATKSSWCLLPAHFSEAGPMKLLLNRSSSYLNTRSRMKGPCRQLASCSSKRLLLFRRPAGKAVYKAFHYHSSMGTFWWVADLLPSVCSRFFTRIKSTLCWSASSPTGEKNISSVSNQSVFLSGGLGKSYVVQLRLALPADFVHVASMCFAR